MKYEVFFNAMKRRMKSIQISDFLTSVIECRETSLGLGRSEQEITGILITRDDPNEDVTK